MGSETLNKSFTMLLVDDEEDIRECWVELLENPAKQEVFLGAEYEDYEVEILSAEDGDEALEIVKSENIHQLGEMFDQHWQYKKKLSSGVSNKRFDAIYDIAKKNGAQGGKISGAGGGGFFTFYCEKNHHQLRKAMNVEGLIELDYNFDFDGSKIVSNHT